MEFNPQQLEAINSNADAILCLAAAGCGKTAVIVARIARLVNDGVDPSTILALTFTNAAAFEMKQRYNRLQTNPSKNCPEFKTFHGFCYSVIIKNRDVREKLGYEKVPQVCDEADHKKLKKELLLQLGLKISETEIDEGIAYGREHERQLEIFNKALKKELRTRNLITFDMMCYNVCELFVNDDESIQYYKNKYKYIFCDEFQDTDKKQFKFISSFGRNINFFLVGDALQAIYGWRGCTNEYVKTLAEASTWKLIKLNQNYRSTKQICEFANRFSKYAKDSYRVVMEGQRDGDEVETIRGACAGFACDVDERHLRLLVQHLNDDPVESAILCRSNKEVNAVANYLKSKGIEYVRSSKTSEALFLLNSALDNNYMKEWLSTWLEGPEYADYIRLSAVKGDTDIRWFLSLYGNKEKIKERVTKIVKIRKIVTDDSTSTQGKVSDIKKVLKVKASKEFEVDDSMTGRQIVETLRDQVLEDEESKIYLGTIHSAKGLEYEHVYVMGVNDRLFQIDTEEMKNLFYVAITRPKNHLTIFMR